MNNAQWAEPPPAGVQGQSPHTALAMISDHFIFLQNRGSALGLNALVLAGCALLSRYRFSFGRGNIMSVTDEANNTN